MKLVQKITYARFSVLIPLISTIVITPGLNTETQILGKFTFFCISVLCLALILNQKLSLTFYKLWGWLALVIMTSFIASVLINRQNFSEQLFGVYGRNNGLILVISSILFFLISNTLVDESLGSLVLKRLSQAGWIVIIYFYIQIADWDVITWNQLYSSPTSTLGNPNFLSAFISIFLLANLGLFLSSQRKFKDIASLIFCLTLGLIAMHLTNSQQGILLFLAGIWLFLGKFMFEKKTWILIKAWLSLTGIFLVVITLGVAEIGPGKRIFDEYSLATRREYWLAGLSMFKKKPIFGNGLDSYLYNFDNNKSANFVRLHGEELTSSSAHNIYIDLLQGAGLIAALAYFTLNFLVTFFAIKRFLKGNVSHTFGALLVIWLIIQIQSLISIQNIAINAWQWLIAGFLVNNLRNSQKSYPGTARAKVGESNPKQKVIKPILTVLIVSLLVAAPMALFQDIKFAGAIKTSNGNALINLARTFPFDTYRANYTAKALEDGEYWYWAIEVAKKSVSTNPKNKDGWILILYSKLSTSLEKQQARGEILKLDPFWRPT